tara:strand:- start:71 stop:556 length:486 start_codon:yes stop_codon:yes gene_type:complete
MLKNIISKIEIFLVKKNSFNFILINFITLLLIVTPFIFLKYFLNISSINTIMANSSNLKQFFVGVILGPIIETLIFQILVIKLVLIITNKKSIVIFSSAFIFGLTHYFSFFYFTYAFTVGLFFAYLYFLSELKKINPFLTLLIVHSLYNLLIFLSFLFNIE